jgi:hypothetical protein
MTKNNTANRNLAFLLATWVPKTRVLFLLCSFSWINPISRTQRLDTFLPAAISPSPRGIFHRQVLFLFEIYTWLYLRTRKMYYFKSRQVLVACLQWLPVRLVVYCQQMKPMKQWKLAVFILKVLPKYVFPIYPDILWIHQTTGSTKFWGRQQDEPTSLSTEISGKCLKISKVCF